jgi:phosphatidylglycerophosphate synthase
VPSRRDGALPDLAGYRAAWQAHHGGYDARSSRLVSAWLALCYRLGRPLASTGCPAGLVTACAVGAAGAAAGVATLGGRWWLAAAGLVVADGVLDGVDGAVAMLAGTATPAGALADSLGDRVADAALLVALWRTGAPGGLTVAGAAAIVLLEYARARAGAVGFRGIGRVTVGERPTRLGLAALTLLTAGLVPSVAGTAALAGTSALLAVAGVGAVQFLRTAWPSLRAAADPPRDRAATAPARAGRASRRPDRVRPSREPADTSGRHRPGPG